AARDDIGHREDELDPARLDRGDDGRAFELDLLIVRRYQVRVHRRAPRLRCSQPGDTGLRGTVIITPTPRRRPVAEPSPNARSLMLRSGQAPGASLCR